MHFLLLEAIRKLTGHKHVKLPGRLVHVPSHPPLAVAHSSSSILDKEKKLQRIDFVRMYVGGPFIMRLGS